MTQLNCSPCTSTPCQNEDVAKSTALGVRRNSSRRRSWAHRPATAAEIHLAEQALDIAHLGIAGEEHKGASAGGFENSLYQFGGLRGKLRSARVRQVGRYIEEEPDFHSRNGRDDDFTGCSRPSLRRTYSKFPPTASVAEVRITLSSLSNRLFSGWARHQLEWLAGKC